MPAPKKPVKKSKNSETTERETAMVQVALEKELHEAAKLRAREVGMTLGTWVRYQVKKAAETHEVDAWAADSEPPKGMLATWEATSTGHYRLEVVGRPLHGYMTVRVKQKLSTGREFTPPLSVSGLDADPTVFGHQDENKRIVYVRGGSFWRVVHRMQEAMSESALVTLQFIGTKYPTS